MARDLSRLLRPRSIAVLGSGWAENVVQQCERIGFGGDIWPVHPTRKTIGGRPCFASLSDLPAPPDASFVGVNRHATLDVVHELAAMKAGGAICFASGWAETGDADLQADLVAKAGEMAILGPNCYGLLNMLDGAVIWPDQHGGRACDTGVAILSQSSNIAINLSMQARGLPIAYVGCLGNAAQIGMAELARAFLADDRVTALGIYAEGFGDAPALAALAQEARAQGKGIVVIKSGKSAASASAAASHTAALSGAQAASSAFMARAGIGEVDTPAELIETLKILHVHGPLAGRRICSLSCSGGEAGLVGDLSQRTNLTFPPLSDTQKAALFPVLGSLVTLSNPLDYHTFIWGDLEKTTHVFTETLRPYDAGMYLIDPPRGDLCDPGSFDPALQAIALAGAATGKPAFPVASLPENFDETWMAQSMAQGVVPLCGIETALKAIEAASTPATDDWAPLPAAHPRKTQMIDEAAGKAELAQIAIRVPRGLRCATLADAPQHMHDLTPPFALKGLGFAHKTENGAVRLGLETLVGEPDIAGASGYLIEEMVTNSIAEMIIGMRRDPVYGATVMLGFGGTQAELLGDTQTLVLPVSEPDIRAALARLRLFPLLTGYRGRRHADIDAIVQTVMILQSHLRATPAIEEIEINPLMVLAQGAVAVDVLIQKEIP